MGKVKKKVVKGVKGLSRRPPLSGDLYVLKTDLEIADVDGDGVEDLTYSHQVLKNDEVFVEAKVTWYGLNVEVANQFVGVLEEVGIVDDDVFETSRFNEVLKRWKQLTKALAEINKLGDVVVQQLGEPVLEVE